MAPKSACILFAILSVLAVAFPITAAASSGTRIGGWQPIENPSAPEVVAVAKFAVAAYNNEQKKTSLNFVSVVRGETQLVEGTNYRLVISATYAGAVHPKNFNAVVYSDLKHSLKLISFRPEYCTEC